MRNCVTAVAAQNWGPQMHETAAGKSANLVCGRAQQQHLGGDAARRRRHRRRLDLRRPEVAVPQNLRTKFTCKLRFQGLKVFITALLRQNTAHQVHSRKASAILQLSRYRGDCTVSVGAHQWQRGHARCADKGYTTLLRACSKLCAPPARGAPRRRQFGWRGPAAPPGCL